MDATLQDRKATFKKRDLTKAEALSVVEAFKKTVEFARIAENHYLSKLIKFYCDWTHK